MKVAAPSSIDELLQRAQRVAGFSLAALAAQLGIALPASSVQGKGFAGQLLELCLGATAGSLPEPDFQELGVELKTIPINQQGKPLESTYVSVVPLTGIAGMTWETSDVYAKLQKVLWVPIVTEKGMAIADRVVGTPILWQPSVEQEAILRQDWEEAMEHVAMGELEQMTARFGTYLQVRPKGANASALTKTFGPEGEMIMTLPRGFYLRPSFTAGILSHLL